MMFDLYRDREGRDVLADLEGRPRLTLCLRDQDRKENP
jgi:hypothetical protein